MQPAEVLNEENIEGNQENSESNKQEILACFDLVTAILSKLPVKSLLRFRSVSKSWLALIDSPEFIKYHLSLSTNKNKDFTNHMIMLSIAQPEFNFKDCSIMDEPNLDYQMKSSGISFVIEGSINGLICLVNEANELFLWNPTVRKYKKLPYFETKSSNDGSFIYGFGYDEIHDDYKIVRIFSIKGRLRDFQEVNMYSLRNNSWRRIHCYQNGTRLIGSGKFVNGKLYWATTASLGMKRGWSITSFDLVDEKWRKVERPCHEEGDGVLVLGVLGSNLSMIYNNSITHVDVWTMTEYENKESWRKMFTINCPLDPVDYFFSQSFCLSKRGEFLLMFDDTFMIYNPKDNLIRYSEFSKFDYGLLTDFYIQSLVCPFSQNEPETQQE